MLALAAKIEPVDPNIVGFISNHDAAYAPPIQIFQILDLDY